MSIRTDLLTDIGPAVRLVERCLIVTLAFLLVFQSMKLREAKEANQLAQLRSPGDILPVIAAVDPAGDTVRVADPPFRENELIILLSPGCEFCAASVGAWREILTLAADVPHVRIIALTTADLQETESFLREHLLDVSVGLLMDNRHVFALRADVVPQVLVVRSEGRIVASHAGILSRETPEYSALLHTAEVPQ